MSKQEEQQLSFKQVEEWEIPPIQPNSVEIGTLPAPIWTETKAQLIQNYLRLFLFITKHGVYIDGFSGPQDINNPGSWDTTWAAKLVLEIKPEWMKNFFLSELNQSSYNALTSMINSQPQIKGRSIEPHRGDFNVWVDSILKSGVINDKKATFALLDQRSIECEWSTVEKLARHKRGDTKIELFYFFPTGWIHRTIAGVKDESLLDRWWGDDSWKDIINTSHSQATHLATEKIKNLGYRDVKAWPICSREEGEGRAMYHMIHATDHLEAPKLMYRAYKNLIGNVPPGEQLHLNLYDVDQNLD